MLPLLTAAQMRCCDAYTIHTQNIPSRTLMERAARSAIETARHFPAVAATLTPAHRILVLCGGGNNGGDGFALARFLFDEGLDVRVCYAGALATDGNPDRTRMSAECARQAELWQVAGGILLTELPLLRPGRTLVVDALFGIGLDRPVEGKTAAWIDAVNAAVAQYDTPVLALDIPSGIHADSGAVLGCAIHATLTATFAAPKRGLLLYPGAAHAGQVTVCDIGITTAPLDDLTTYQPTPEDLRPLAHRPVYANKGTFGRIAVIGGASGMCGATYFAAKTAYRAGAGLVEILTEKDNRIPLQALLPEALLTSYDAATGPEQDQLTAILHRADSIVLGCGLGQSAPAAALVQKVLTEADQPLVVDADALNLIAAHPALADALTRRSAPTVLTPHLGEASRLCGRTVRDIAADLIATADGLATRFGAVCVLKDTRTVVSDGQHRYIQACGNSGMATGGAGDCLAGLLGAILAIQTAPGSICPTPAKMAALGVLWHAMAGDLAADHLGQHALMASDLADSVGQVMQRLS